jgi:6-phosphogluconolactonase
MGTERFLPGGRLANLKKFLLIAAILTVPLASYSQVSNDASESKRAGFLLYVGNYDKGVFGYLYYPETGEVQAVGWLSDLTNPSFLAADPHNQHLYAVSEVDGDVGGVAAYGINARSSVLSPLNTRSSEGEAPCHVSVDGTGKVVVVANYGTGQVVVFPIAQDGSLGEASQLLSATGSSVNKARQSGPHAHEAVWSPDNRFVYVPDLGLDEIRIYKFNSAAKKLSAADPAFAKLHAGNGPRHIALSSDGKFAYVINELTPAVTVFTRDRATGALTQIQELPLTTEGYQGESAPAEIELDRAGRFLYASNRGPGTITVFAVTPGEGTLKQVQVAETGGTWPRAFAIDPAGRFLFVGDQKANSFVVFAIDAEAGTLKRTGDAVEAPSPVSFVFVPAK